MIQYFRQEIGDVGTMGADNQKVTLFLIANPKNQLPKSDFFIWYKPWLNINYVQVTPKSAVYGNWRGLRRKELPIDKNYLGGNLSYYSTSGF